MPLSAEIQEIDDWFKQRHNYFCSVRGVSRLDPDDELFLSDEYKAKHNALIEKRKADESQLARVQAFTATHSERACRTCHVALAPHVSRGRPPVNCESCRDDLARKS